MAGTPSIKADKTISFLDAVFRWGLVGISLVAPLVFVKGLYDFADLPQSAFIQIGSVSLLAVWLLKSCIKGECLVLKSVFYPPLILLVAWSLVSMLYGHNRYEGLLVWMHWAASALVFFLVVNSGRGMAFMRLLLTAVFVSGILCAFLGIAQHFLGLSWVPQAVPPAATFANKNMAVHFIILCLPVGAGLLLTQKHRMSRYLLLPAMLVMIGFLACTKNRAAIVSLAAEGILLTALLVRTGRRKTALGLATVCLALAIAMSLAVRKDFNVSSVDLRLAIWRNTLEMIKDRPWLGYGLGNHGIFYPLYHRKAIIDTSFTEAPQLNYVHNDFIQAAAELGILGSFALAWMGLVLIKTAFALTSSHSPSDIRLLTTGIAVGIAGLLTNACFCFPFHRAIPPFVFMLFVGILARFRSGPETRFHAISNRSVLLPACIVALVVLACLIRFHYLAIQADHHFLHVTGLENLGHWRAVIAEGEEAMKHNPLRLKTLSYVGRGYLETGRHKKGIDLLQKVLGDYPNSITDLFNMALAYDKIGDDDAAMNTYKKVLQIKPDYPKAHNNMANIYLKRNNPDKALQELKLAARLEPENSVIHFNVGMVEIIMKRYQDAERAFETAHRLRRRPGLDQTISLEDQAWEVIQYLNSQLKLHPGREDEAQMRRLIDRVGRFGEALIPPPHMRNRPQ